MTAKKNFWAACLPSSHWPSLITQNFMLPIPIPFLEKEKWKMVVDLTQKTANNLKALISLPWTHFKLVSWTVQNSWRFSLLAGRPLHHFPVGSWSLSSSFNQLAGIQPSQKWKSNPVNYKNFTVNRFTGLKVLCRLITECVFNSWPLLRGID